MPIESQAKPWVESEPSHDTDSARARIITATVDLLNTKGRDAVTTRAVADAAGVQAPTIYRLFHDKAGLLDAAASCGFTTYLEEKTLRGEPGQDAVDDLRIGWDAHVTFGLTHPALYVLMYAEPRPGRVSRAAEASHRFLKEKMRRIAAVGRLRLSEEQAANVFHSLGCGTVLTLLSQSEKQRDMRLSEIAREAAITTITTGTPTFEASGSVAAAVALRAVLPETELLSKGERSLLIEWLDRLAASPG